MTDSPSRDDAGIRADQDAEEILERFDSAWQDGRKPLIAHYLPSPDSSTESDPYARRHLLEELIKIDLEYRWRRRRRSKATHRGMSTIKDKARELKRKRLPARPHLEDYVRQFQELGSLEDLPVGLIAEEYRVRARWGDKPGHDVY